LSQNDGSINHSIKTGGTTVNITALGIDIAKNVFQLHGIDANWLIHVGSGFLYVECR
jgi:hypothetical protein